MRLMTAGALAGLIGGVVMTAGMVGGRRAGVLEKTLAEESEDWLDEKFDTRRRLGDTGTTAIEQADHMLTATAFGVAYAKAKSYVGNLPWPLAGAAYGAGLYAVNIVGLAPLLGITRGEWNERPRVIGQRLGMHVLFGIATALAYELFSDAQTHKRALPAPIERH
jgi:predicted outer membrane lipoprotein